MDIIQHDTPVATVTLPVAVVALSGVTFRMPDGGHATPEISIWATGSEARARLAVCIDYYGTFDADEFRLKKPDQPILVPSSITDSPALVAVIAQPQPVAKKSDKSLVRAIGRRSFQPIGLVLPNDQ